MGKQRYFDWLCCMAGSCSESEFRSHRKVLRVMHETPYRSDNPFDENRAYDGIDLRDQFVEECGVSERELDDLGDCTVLEALVALAVRIEMQIMEDDVVGPRTARWFYAMLSSLGLAEMYDKNFDEYVVRAVLETWLDGRYSFDGDGSPFYVPDYNGDIHKRDLWGQAHAYLLYLTKRREYNG